MLKTVTVRATSLAATILTLLPITAIADTAKRIDIPAGALSVALLQLSTERGADLVYRPEQVQGLKTKGAHGALTTEQAVTQLLMGTKLKMTVGSTGAILIAAPGSNALSKSANEGKPARGGDASREGLRLGQSDQAATPQPSSLKTERKDSSRQNEKRQSVQLEEVAIPEILIRGAKTLDMDIRRTHDDIQPYVILDRAQIESSGAVDLEDFLKQRLPMNAQAESPQQAGSPVTGNLSLVNLRGLGTNQTLILVDGHRSVSQSVGNVVGQSDINGIPLSAIERIEILPTTASGIYGGGATGGVINVVLRRDYSGTEVKLGYQNTFDSVSPTRRIDLSEGLSLEGGRTSILLTASYSDGNGLEVRDRDFLQRLRANILVNDPTLFTTATTPPQGSTPNIRSANGSPLFGPGTSNFTSVPAGYAGGGGIGPLLANAGVYNLGLGDDQFSGLNSAGGRLNLWNSPTVESLNATLRRQFNSHLDAFLELTGSNNDSRTAAATLDSTFTVGAGAPNNPFGQDILVTLPSNGLIHGNEDVITHDFNRKVVAGLIAALPRGWKAEGDYTWNRFHATFQIPSFSPFSPALAQQIHDGTLDVLRDTLAHPIDFSPYITTAASYTDPFISTLKDATLRVAGPVAFLPAGPATVTTLVEHRDETSDASQEAFFISPTTPLSVHYPARSQAVDSVYAEALVPIFSSRNQIGAVRELELQLAARHDHYRITGTDSAIFGGSTTPVSQATNKLDSTDPTLGLRYRPLQDLMVRASYGTGFLPPSVDQLIKSPSFASGTDPKRGNQPTGTVPAFFGGNPNLRPEKSKSWSAGLVLTPRPLPGLRVSIDYTHIQKTDDITTLSTQVLIDNEGLFPGRITRGRVLPGDTFGVGPITFIDNSSINIARATLEAYDFEIDYDKETAEFGSFEFYAIGTSTQHFKTQTLPSLPVTENVGNGFLNPLRFRANAGLTWKYRHWTAGWTAEYYNSYIVSNISPTVILEQGSMRVSRQIYHNLFVSYLSAVDSGALRNTEFQLTVNDVFNTRPPLDAGSPSGASLLGDPRQATYGVTIRKSF